MHDGSVCTFNLRRYPRKRLMCFKAIPKLHPLAPSDTATIPITFSKKEKPTPMNDDGSTIFDIRNKPSENAWPVNSFGNPSP